MLNIINLNEDYRNSFEKFTMTFQCPHCTRNFSRRASLRNHIKTHENVIENYLQEIAEKINNPVVHDEDQYNNEMVRYNPSDDTRFDLESILDDEQLDEQ